MRTEKMRLPLEWKRMAARQFVLLESQHVAKQLDAVRLNLSGYSDVMHLIADVVKVCLLAMENETSSKRVPEPHANISGVLSIVLDLLPYEEAELLDALRAAVLEPEEELDVEYFLVMPKELREQLRVGGNDCI